MHRVAAGAVDMIPFLNPVIGPSFYHDAAPQPLRKHLTGENGQPRRWRRHMQALPHGEVAEAIRKVRDLIEVACRRTDLFERRRRLMDDWASYLDPLKAASR